MKNTLDMEQLGSYLRAEISDFGNLQKVEKFSDGQSNPTYLLTADTGQFVLRSQPSGELLQSAHAVDREFRVMSALRQTSVPVPKAMHLCEDKSLTGTMFFVMSYEPGRIFWNPMLPTLSSVERTGIYDEMNRVLAALHDVDLDHPGLRDFGKPGNYFHRQVDRWSRQYRASETESIPAMEQLMDWLPVNLPDDDGAFSLIHGDYRIDNIIFNTDSTQVRAVLDWELSTLGHPFADLAYQCMQWRLANDAVIPGLGGLDRPGLGIPAETEYVERYCKRRGISSITHWNVYLVFSFFRLAAILQGVLKRSLDGNASSQRAREYGALAPVLAEMATELL